MSQHRSTEVNSFQCFNARLIASALHNWLTVICKAANVSMVHVRAVYPVPELPAGLLSTASKEEPTVTQPVSTTDSHSRHYLTGMQLGRPEPHHDGADVVPEGIDSPRRAPTPGPAMTPRAVSRIGVVVESRAPGSKEGGPGGEEM